MWIVCLADDSHEMPSFIFSEKIIYFFRMLSAAILLSTLMVYCLFLLKCHYNLQQKQTINIQKYLFIFSRK